MAAEWLPAWPLEPVTPYEFVRQAFRVEAAGRDRAALRDRLSSKLGLAGLRSFVVTHLPAPMNEPSDRIAEVTDARPAPLFSIVRDEVLADRLGRGIRAAYESNLSVIASRGGGKAADDVRYEREHSRADAIGFRAVAPDGNSVGSMAFYHLDDPSLSRHRRSPYDCYALADGENRTVFYNSVRPAPYGPGGYGMDTLTAPGGSVLLQSAQDPREPVLLFKDITGRSVASVGMGKKVDGVANRRAWSVDLMEPTDALGPLFLALFNHLYFDLVGVLGAGSASVDLAQRANERAAVERREAITQLVARRAEKSTRRS